MDGDAQPGRGVPFFQTQGLWPSAQGDVPSLWTFSVVLAQLMPTGSPQLQAAAGREHFPGFEVRAFVEEAARRVWHPAWGEGSLSFPFPRKLWTIVNSHRFVSIWRGRHSTCVGVSESTGEHFGEGGLRQGI